MEWREQSAVSSDEAFLEAQRWIEAVTKKKFSGNDFRSSLENGVLFCDLINTIKPGIIKRVNRLPTPIAGLLRPDREVQTYKQDTGDFNCKCPNPQKKDNLNVFLKACGKLGLKEAQLFHPGDLQDLSTRVTVKDQETSRRLKNVLITIYWLGRRAQSVRLYDGPYLNFKAFEGLLGTALYKALKESSSQKGSNVRDSGFGDSWYSEREGGGGGRHRREDSLDSLDSLGSRPHSISSDTTLKGSSEGCGSDTEADSVFSMAENKDTLSYRRSVSITPKPTGPFNQFLPTKDKATGYVPAPLRKKRADRNEESRRSWANPTYVEDEAPLTSETRLSSDYYGNSGAAHSASPASAAHVQWAYDYESGSDSDTDRPDPDLVLDDLASRRFTSPSPALPTNFAMPISPLAEGRASRGRGGPWPKVTMNPNVGPPQSVTCLSSVGGGETQRPQHATVRVDHRRAVSADSLFREIYDYSEDEDDEVGYADPVQDDLYARKMGLKPQPAGSVSHDKFLPKFWTPEEDIHIQKIKLGSKKRPWYKKMQGFSHTKSGSSSDDSECDTSPWLSSAPSPSHSHTHEASAHTTLVVGKRQLQTQQSFDGSKSTSDIAVDSSVIRQARYEELQKHREKQKETEDEWQNDLTKWKSRRRSVNSDIVKKKEEREFIEQVTSGGSDNRRSKTYKEMQDERENKGSNNNSVGGRLKSSLSYLDKDEDDVFDQPVAPLRRRTLPPRSSTIDTPYFSSEPPEPSLREADPPAVSSATGRAASWEVKTVDSPAGSDTTTTSTSITIPAPPIRSSLRSSQPPSTIPLRRSPVPEHTSSSTVKTEKTTTVVSPPSYMQKAPEPRRPLSGTQTEAEAPSSGSLLSKRQPQFSSIMEPKPPGVSRVSASLPRSYQRPDSALLTSVVTPRPFGTTSSRITSLPRASTMDDPHKRVNGDVDVSKRSSVPTRYQQFITSEEDVLSQSSSAHSSEDEEEEEEGKTPAKSVPSALNISPVPPQVKSVAPVSPAPAKDTSQEHCEMRISLNQKPNSSRDFGFQSTWDSTGARVTSVQPGSPAEMCRLQTGDEVLTVNRQQVAEMSYTDWKTCMEEALQEGSLVMDIRRHGKNNWDRDQPSLPFKHHKTINLTSTDHPILLGSLDANVVSPTLDFTSRTSTEKLPSKDAPTHTVIDVASNGVNGGFREQPVTMRNKEAEPLSMKNLKRRSEFFEKGGSENAMPDIPVPPITPSVSRWSWNPEEERKRQEKWQKEQEVLLQEKYKRDQEKLQEEWTKAQQEITESRDQQEPGSVEVDVGPHSPLSPQVYQPTAPSAWEEEERERERQRKEEQERHRQAEERRKREEEERELQRLQEQRERKEREEEEERKSREEEELRWQKRREEELREEERKRQEAAEQQRRARERALQQQQQQQQQQQWAGGSQGFAQPPLSYSDRVKSKSSPQLDEEENTLNKGVHMQPGGMAQWLLEEQLRKVRDKQAQSQLAASELEMERRNILNAMRYRQPERVTGSRAGDKKGQQTGTQAEAERQQILNEMKKKTSLLTDGSWIRQSAADPTANKESDVPPMRRGESLDNLDVSYNSWRSSWTPRTNSFSQNYSRPNSALSGNTYTGGLGAQQRPGSSTLPSSYSMSSLRGGAGNPSSNWPRQSPSPSPSSPSPATSPEPLSDGGGQQQRSRSVSGKKICTLCDTPLGKGAAMIIESLGLCYHLTCFKCIDCKSELGGSEAGAEVRIRNKQLYCNTCYMRFKTGQPTVM